LAQICGNFAGSSAPSSSKYGNIERAALPNGTLESQLATTVRQWRLIRGVSNSLDQYTFPEAVQCARSWLTGAKD
jgi:hypothetical protein